MWLGHGVGGVNKSAGSSVIKPPNPLPEREGGTRGGERPKTGRGEPRSSSSGRSGAVWTLGTPRGFGGGGVEPFVIPQPNAGTPQTPPKAPFCSRGAPKGLRRCLSSAFWKGKTPWIRFNFPAMTWKGGEKRGETDPGGFIFFFPPFHGLEKLLVGGAGLGWSGPPQHPPSTPPPAPPQHPLVFDVPQNRHGNGVDVVTTMSLLLGGHRDTRRTILSHRDGGDPPCTPRPRAPPGGCRRRRGGRCRCGGGPRTVSSAGPGCSARGAGYHSPAGEGWGGPAPQKVGPSQRRRVWRGRSAAGRERTGNVNSPPWNAGAAGGIRVLTAASRSPGGGRASLRGAEHPVGAAGTHPGG